MTWEQRWILVFLLTFIVQPLLFYPATLLILFWIGVILGSIYLVGQLVFFCRAIYRKLRDY